MALSLPHNDEPTETDRFQRGHLSKEIATVAAMADPPLVLGVHGDWGSGKTSFMLQVHNALGQGPHKSRVARVWFEAWRYQNESVPVVALLHEMRRQFPFLKKSRGEAKKIAQVTYRSVLLASFDQVAKLIGAESVAKTVPIAPDKIQSIGEAWEKEHLQSPLPSNDLRNFLQTAIDALLPPAKKGLPPSRVVIFIDDLDRCNADMAYKLLEGLKIYLNLKNCVFVLAMNQQIVVKALASVMKKDDDDARVRLEAEAYLEKLCANIWRLPPPPDPVGYLAGLLREEVPRLAIKDTAAQAGHRFLPPNPRRLKALANLYNRLWRHVDVAAAPNSNLLALRVLVVAYVYQFHSELYQRWRHEPRFFLKLKDWLLDRSPQEEKTAYFAGLSLPTRLGFDASAATDQTVISNCPDPATPGMFWIAPLLQPSGPLDADGPMDYRELLNLDHPDDTP
jgi:hypothetical protein